MTSKPLKAISRSRKWKELTRDLWCDDEEYFEEFSLINEHLFFLQFSIYIRTFLLFNYFWSHTSPWKKSTAWFIEKNQFHESAILLFDRYHKISKESRISIEGILSEKHYAKNELLQNIGHTCKTIYFLKSGIARIYYYRDGIDITESFSFENNIIARVESLFTGKPSSKAIQIIEYWQQS